MFKKISLLATLAIAIFALPGCFGHSSYVYHTSSATAVASVAYYGPHPVYDVYGDSDWCSISGAHTHSYAPDSDDFYVINNGRYVFVGDPSYYVSNINFNTYYYMGEHPLNVGNGWCYIQGPHRHHWAASGYYNYTRVGSYNYYTYYGSRNSYYDPGHTRYDLHSYYSSHPPVRYTSNHYGTVGMSSYHSHDHGHVNTHDSGYHRPNGNGVYTAPTLNGSSSHSSSSSVVRPSNSGTTVSRPSNSGTTVSRPSNPSYNTPTVSRPSNSGTTVSRPSNPSYNTPTVSRPSNSGTTVIRPSNSSTTVIRPSNPSYNTPTVTRPSTNTGSTVTRPSTNTGSTVTRPMPETRPSVNTGSTVTRPTTVTRPSTNTGSTVSRPSTVTRPSTNTGSTVSRPSTVTRPSSNTGSSVSRPSAGSSRPSSSGRVSNASGKTQYMEEEENNNGSNGSSNARSGRSSRGSSGFRGRR